MIEINVTRTFFKEDRRDNRTNIYNYSLIWKKKLGFPIDAYKYYGKPTNGKLEAESCGLEWDLLLSLYVKKDIRITLSLTDPNFILNGISVIWR